MYLSKQKLNRITNYFQGQPVLKAYLFGSYARGEADRKSDIDILVELDWTQPKLLGYGFVGMKLDLEDILRKKVDLVPEDGLSPLLKPFIETDKTLIYVREN